MSFGGGFPTAPVASAADVTALEARMTAAEADIAALQAVPGATPQTYACPSGAAVRQAVYLSGPGAVDIADATDRAKMPAFGFIASKPTSTTCIIQNEHELAGWGGTLTPKARYWIAAGGSISTAPPVADGNGVEQQAGFATTDSILDIELGVTPEAEI